MSEPPDPNQNEALIQKYLAGQLTAAEGESLLGLLREHPSLGTELLDHLQMDDMLSQLIRAEAVAPPLAACGRTTHDDAHHRLLLFPSCNWDHPWVWASALAACLAVLVGLSLLWLPKPTVHQEEGMTHAVAVLSCMVNAASNTAIPLKA